MTSDNVLVSTQKYEVLEWSGQALNTMCGADFSLPCFFLCKCNNFCSVASKTLPLGVISYGFFSNAVTQLAEIPI